MLTPMSEDHGDWFSKTACIKHPDRSQGDWSHWFLQKLNFRVTLWLSGKESACQCRSHGFDLWSGKIPHAMEQLSPWATTTEPVLRRPGATTTKPVCCRCRSLRALAPASQRKKPLQREACTPQLQSSPQSLQVERSPRSSEDPDQIRSDQSLSRVRLFATPWISARQASLSITNSRSSLRLTSIESVMPSSHLILCHTQHSLNTF